MPGPVQRQRPTVARRKVAQDEHNQVEDDDDDDDDGDAPTRRSPRLFAPRPVPKARDVAVSSSSGASRPKAIDVAVSSSMVARADAKHKRVGGEIPNPTPPKRHQRAAGGPKANESRTQDLLDSEDDEDDAPVRRSPRLPLVPPSPVPKPTLRTSSSSSHQTKTSTDRSGDAQAKLEGKRAVISEDKQVHVYHANNPTSATGSKEFDWAEHDRQETKHLLVERMQKTVLDKASNKRVSNQQQAFNIFQIPFELDTKLLSVKELQIELRARFLPHSGTKDQLRNRLEAAIKSEPKKK